MWWWGPCAGASCCSDVVVPKRLRAAALYDELEPLLTDGRDSFEASSAEPPSAALNGRSSSGSMTITPGIYRARDVRTHDAVALKVFAKSVLTHQTKRRRIRQEINVLSQCGEHANILRLYGVYSSKHTFEIAFELASGGEVLQRIAGASDAAVAASQMEVKESPASALAPGLGLGRPLRYRITEREISRVVASAASALRFMHQKGIIHGEVRPEHLLYKDLEPDARVVLVDFGRAAAWRDFTFRSRVHRRQFVWHDPHSIKFLPPFVLEGLSDAQALVDGCSHWKQARQVDVWSLGVTMYVLLCGAFPFDGVTLDEIRSRILTQPLIFPTNTPSRSSGSSTEQEDGIYLSRAAKDLLTKLLEKDPELAPSMEEVCEHPWLSSNVAADVRWSDWRLDEFGSFAESYARDVAASSLRRRTVANAHEASSTLEKKKATHADPMEYDVFGIGGGDNNHYYNEISEEDDGGVSYDDEIERPSFVSTDGVPKSDAYEERLSADAYMRLASAELEAVAARKAATPSPRRPVDTLGKSRSPKPRKSRAPAAAGASPTNNNQEADDHARPHPVADIRGDFWPVFSKQRRLLSLKSLSFRSASSGSKEETIGTTTRRR